MNQPLSIRVLSNLATLDYILTNGCSVARFGDGEIDLITGHSIPYQSYHPDLAKRLKAILQTPSSPELLVCLPDVFERMDRYNQHAQQFWREHFRHYQTFYQTECRSDWYGSTFLSRPYIDLADKAPAAHYFSRLEELWQGKDLLIIEGETSRSGVGNSLFAQARSISRLICPSKHAFAHYDDILETALALATGKLILIMLGPTAKLLSVDLAARGHQAIDLGHIDSEYEWYRMQADRKVKLPHKHTAEFNLDQDITLTQHPDYNSQIIARIPATRPTPSSLERTSPAMTDLLTIIVPVYNTSPYLKRCLDSILKQGYTHFELLLINDGSTDGSARILEDYAKKDKRIQVIHQDNQGVSAARNKGIERAKGDYITFIDSDDFIESDYLEQLHRAATEHDADIAATNFTSFNEERQSFLFYQTDQTYFEKTYSVQEWIDKEGSLTHNLHLVFSFSPLKLFKRNLFDSIRFPIGRLREDDATIYKLYLKANRIHFSNRGNYYYSQRKEGLSRSVMQLDVATMISNAEERITLLVALGYNPDQQIRSYISRLEKCREDALHLGQITLFHTIEAKLQLYHHHQKKDA